MRFRAVPRMLMLPVLLMTAAAGLALPAHRALAGANAGARVRLTWGKSFNDTLTNIDIPAGVDTDLTFWVSAVGLVEMRGADIQLPMLREGDSGKPLPVPAAWQFYAKAPCGNGPGSEITTHFPGSALVDIPNLLTAMSGFYQGTPDRYTVFSGMHFACVLAAGAASVPCDPERRYGLAKGSMHISKDCDGAGLPLCIVPDLRMGQAKDYGTVIGVVDSLLTYDYLPFESGYGQLTANRSSARRGQPCPAPTPVAASAWGRPRSGIRH